MDALPVRRRSGLLVPRTGWINRAASSQNHGGGAGSKTADRAVEVRHRRCSARRRGLKTCHLIGSANPACAATQSSPAIRGNVTVVRHGATVPSTKSGAVLLELSRSRMRDSGWDQLPPDVRFAGKPAETRVPPWITICPHQLLTEIPSCEAEHMAAPTNAALVKKESPCQLGAVHTGPGVSLK